jgi:hypothetical protein
VHDRVQQWEKRNTGVSAAPTDHFVGVRKRPDSDLCCTRSKELPEESHAVQAGGVYLFHRRCHGLCRDEQLKRCRLGGRHSAAVLSSEDDE